MSTQPKPNTVSEPQTNPAQPGPNPPPGAPPASAPGAEPEIPVRQSKIARLPIIIRTELNERLDRGEQNINVVRWLNNLPEVRKHPSFPITAVNVSAWKSGPFRDWQRHRDMCVAMGLAVEQSGEFREAAGGKATMTEALASMLSIELTHFARHWLDSAPNTEEKWKRLKELLRELSIMRRADHQAARLAMDQDRWRAEVEEREEHEQKKAENRKLFEGHDKELKLHMEMESFVKGMKADMDREDFERHNGELKEWVKLAEETNQTMTMAEAKDILAKREARLKREREEAEAAAAAEEETAETTEEEAEAAAAAEEETAETTEEEAQAGTETAEEPEKANLTTDGHGSTRMGSQAAPAGKPSPATGQPGFNPNKG